MGGGSFDYFRLGGPTVVVSSPVLTDSGVDDTPRVRGEVWSFGRDLGPLSVLYFVFLCVCLSLEEGGI